MSKKLIAILVCVVAMASITIAPIQAANPEPASPSAAGPYVVGYTEIILTDTSRNQDIGGRPIAVDIWYPADPENNGQPLLPAEYVMDPYDQYGFDDIGLPTTPSTVWEEFGVDPAFQAPTPSPDGPFPLLVFSPGWGCDAWYYLYVGARLASHGFVVAITTNYGEYVDNPAMPAVDRTMDVPFVITDLLARDQDPDELLYGMINEEQIALSGHSLGGYATMALAGGDALACDTYMEWGGYIPPESCVPVLPDPRIKAIVTLDGSNQFLHFSELAQITLPAMGIGQEWSTLAIDPPWTSWQARQHAAMQGNPNYRVDVAGAQHLNFANWCEYVDVLYYIGYIDEETYNYYKCSPEPIPQTEVERLTMLYMIAFLKVNLVGDHRYQAYLTPGYALGNEPDIEFFVTEKRNPHAVDEDWPDNFLYFMHQPGSEQAIGPKNPHGPPETRMSPFVLP